MEKKQADVSALCRLFQLMRLLFMSFFTVLKFSFCICNNIALTEYNILYN